jgi:hypothetical protein
MKKYGTYRIYQCENCSRKLRIPEGIHVTEFFFPGVTCITPPHEWKRNHKLEEVEAKKIREPD